VYIREPNESVPIDPATCDEFDPFAVPTLSQLHKEMNDYNEQQGPTEDSASKMQDYQKTSLAPYVKHFELFVQGLLKEVKKKRAEASMSLDF